MNNLTEKGTPDISRAIVCLIFQKLLPLWAKIYAGQGHYVIAAEIYRHLLRENPDRRDWADALAQIEAKLAARSESRPRDPAGRLAEWIGLMLSYRRLLDLRDIRRQIAQKNTGGRK